MVPRWKTHMFQNSRCSLMTWVTVLVMLLAVGDGIAGTHHRAMVGDNFTFRCPSNKRWHIKFFYLQRHSVQKDTEFVNGYYVNKQVPKTWPGTTLDSNDTAVHFHKLNVSNSGEYLCLIQYTKDQSPEQTTLHLTVTATYSKPTVSMVCVNENHGCSYVVTCSSHGGYPSSKVTWNVSGGGDGGRLWKTVNTSEVSDPITMLVNTSSTAYFNCSHRVLQSFNCSVTGIPSDTFTVCEPEKPPDSSTPYVIVAICAVVVVSILTISLVFIKCRKRRSRGVNGHVESTYTETVTLHVHRKEGESS